MEELKIKLEKQEQINQMLKEKQEELERILMNRKEADPMLNQVFQNKEILQKIVLLLRQKSINFNEYKVEV